MLRFLTIFVVFLLLSSCAPGQAPSAEIMVPELERLNDTISPGFVAADGTRPLSFPKDFGAHEEFRTEWWYYTGNLQTPEGRPFGFELTIFRVGLLPPTTELPANSGWYGQSVYFAHFAVSDIKNEKFYAFERYSRPGPGLAGAQAEPYRVWLEDWRISEQEPGLYTLQASQDGVAIELNLADEMGVVLHGEQGYSRKGAIPANASYYYSQPRLHTEGFIKIDSELSKVSGLAWKDHEFSTSVLDENQIGWDWFSLQFENGPALMLYQLRERRGAISSSSSGTYIDAQGNPLPFEHDGFAVSVLDQWRSPLTDGVYPAAWEIRLKEPGCLLQVRPWMADQEIHFSAVTYWEGAVRFEGECDGSPVRGNGYVELTGYAGNLPIP